LKADERFLKQPKSFWASVRLISQTVGYTERGGGGKLKQPTISEIALALKYIGLNPAHVLSQPEVGNDLGNLLVEYFHFRAALLYDEVQHLLMNEHEAKALFEELYETLKPTCPIPLNKQKGQKRAPAFLTAIVNMLIEKHSGGMTCDFDPRQLTTITHDDVPLRTLARRVDGAFPTVINPIAIWEIKEYYYTTTFGSRVADGVYESLLDGLELEELRDHEGINVLHYLIVDAHKTWWIDGRSYLCRMIDMLHMGYVDEVLFGKEVVTRLPILVEEWVRLARR